MRNPLPVVFAICVAALAALGQLQIHVMPGAAGRAGEGAPLIQPGSVGTLDAAIDKLAAARAAGDRSPAEIVLYEAVYPLERPLELTSAIVGDGLTIAPASPAMTPTISGGREIGGWRAAEDGTWRATIDAVRDGSWWFEELYVNGRYATRARHPNKGFARVVAAGPDNRTSFAFDPIEVPPSLIDDRSEVVFIHDWSISRVRIASVDAASSTVTFANPIGCSMPHFAITNFEPHPRYFLEGGPLLVDAPGEWALDRAAGELVYMPLPGESIESVHAIAPAATALLRVTGTPEEPVRNVTIRDVRFALAGWPIPEYGYAEGQASFYEQRDSPGSDGTRDPVPAAVEFAWANDCAIERCIVESVGGAGVSFGAGCRGCGMTDSIVRGVGASGVMIGEAAGRVVDGQPWWQAAPEQAASGNAVRHCLIERCGRRFFGAVGVWIGLTAETTVANCEIRDLPYTGVSVGWRWDETPTPCRANVIEANHIHHVMQTLSDGGGIYTLGLQPGTVLRGNAIHNVPANAGRAPSNGMFLDQGTTGIIIEDNLFWAIDTTPLRWHWTYKNVVRGNTFVVREGQQLVRYDRATETDIAYESNREIAETEWTEEAAKQITGGAGPRE